MFKSIFVWEKNRAIPPTYTTLSMILACLKAIGCHPDDLIILALDSPKGSWRRDIDSAYKANRKENREKHDIDWDLAFSLFKDFIRQLEVSTPFVKIEIDRLEADDIISAGCRFYKDREVIIISSDSDYEQLAEYSHVKILTPKNKHYKIIKNPSSILAKKIKKETTDNLVSEILTEEDYIRREKIVTLLNLPEDVENKVIEILSRTEQNPQYDLDKLPFKRKMAERYFEIYNEDKITEKIAEKIETKIKKRKLLKKQIKLHL
jgi:5'-3' exonuclease